ncbi:MAG: CDP-alcohol phosphatidyltransferase family protein [Inquilinaceae bacterium]
MRFASSNPTLPSAALHLAGGAVLLAGGLWLAPRGAVPIAVNPLPALIVFGALVALVFFFLPQHRPVVGFGQANRVTLLRGVLTAGLAALIGTAPPIGTVGWMIAGVALAAVILDGIDGWLARIGNCASAFGARFDMETDALFLMVLSVLVHEFGQVGAWVLAIGAMRYVFVAAGRVVPALRRPLPDSKRRKVVCVTQGVVLAILCVPLIPPSLAAVAAAAALALLAWSFFVDTLTLLVPASEPPSGDRS